MFDIGLSELALIGIVALVILGPERLPVVARTAGRWMGKLQRYVATVKADLSQQLEMDEFRRIRQDFEQEAMEVRSQMQQQLMTMQEQLEQQQQIIDEQAKKLGHSPHPVEDESAIAEALARPAAPPLPVPPHSQLSLELGAPGPQASKRDA